MNQEPTLLDRTVQIPKPFLGNASIKKNFLRKWGGGSTLSATKIVSFVKEKKMQNVLKSKICIFEGFRVILIFSLKSYVLDHSESTDMHIEELCKHVRNFFIIFLFTSSSLAILL